MDLSELFVGEAHAADWVPVGRALARAIRRGASSGPRSRTADVLVGRTIEGRVVKDVVVLGPQWRAILFEDGHELPVRKEVLRELVRGIGAKRYVDEFAGLPEEAKLKRALTSLERRKRMQHPMDTKLMKTHFRKMHEKYFRALKSGEELPEYVWVESERLYLPKAYAEILEKHGVIRIKKRGK